MLLETGQITTCFKSSHCLTLHYQLQKTNMKKNYNNRLFILLSHNLTEDKKKIQNPLSGETVSRPRFDAATAP